MLPIRSHTQPAMEQTSITTRSGFTSCTIFCSAAGVVKSLLNRCAPLSLSYSQPTVLYFPKSNAKIFITGYSLLSQILSQPAKAKLVNIVGHIVRLSNRLWETRLHSFWDRKFKFHINPEGVRQTPNPFRVLFIFWVYTQGCRCAPTLG